MMISKIGYKQQGFTMIELLFYVMISSIILVAVFQAASEGRRSYKKTTSSIEEIRAARRAMDAICEELKYSSYVIISTDKTGISSYFYGNETSSRSIFLGDDKIIYKQVGSSAATALMNTSVSSFTCSFNASDTSNRAINLSVQFPNGIQLNTTVYNLNKGTNGYQ
jgi:prepilin-type N-terminal cleavage/methylation domain-containing protein